MPIDPEENLEQILQSRSYRMAEDDPTFIKGAPMRPLRLAMELMKPELALRKHNVRSTIVVFGGTRILEPAEAKRRLGVARRRLARDPEDTDLQRRVGVAERVLAKAPFYEEARKFAALVSKTCQELAHSDYVIVTGGGPGVMEAANRGAAECGCISMGLNITLPFEQAPNPWITPDLCFQFHYFAIRKMHFLMRAKAMVAFPGGFGTLDELFETLTLVQTEVMPSLPIILFGREYWKRLIDFEFLAQEGTIHEDDLLLFQYADTAEEAWNLIRRFYEVGGDKRAWLQAIESDEPPNGA